MIGRCILPDQRFNQRTPEQWAHPGTHHRQSDHHAALIREPLDEVRDRSHIGTTGAKAADNPIAENQPDDAVTEED